MSEKYCSKCRIKKPLTEYYSNKGRKGSHSKCMKCFKEYYLERKVNKKEDELFNKFVRGEIDLFKYREKCLELKNPGLDEKMIKKVIKEMRSNLRKRKIKKIFNEK